MRSWHRSSSRSSTTRRRARSTRWPDEWWRPRRRRGADVRLRQVPELAPEEAIASNAAWSQHFDRTKDEPKATADDIVWADAVLFGSPTRYGNIASQLKQFLDTLGPQWTQGLLTVAGKLVDGHRNGG